MYQVGVRPSYSTGFAQWPGMSEYPELWRGLVGAWDPSLGQTGNRLIDLSGNGYHLAAGASSPTWVGGKLGTATRYSAASDQYFSGDHSPIKVQGSWSVGCWVKAGEDNPADYRDVFYFGDGDTSSNVYLYIAFLSTGQIAVEDRSIGVDVTTAADYADGNWHYVFVNAIGSLDVTLNVYVDGVYVGTDFTSNDSLVHTFTRVAIGMLRDSSPGWPFEGDIGSVVLYNRDLLTSEIALHHQLRKRMA